MAALDLGTNNCRLLVARPLRPGFRDRRQLLADRAARRGGGQRPAGSASGRSRGRSRPSGSAPGSSPGTRSARSAASPPRPAGGPSNGVEFLARVKRVTGLRFEILPHEDEARLALLGCLPLIDPAAEHVLLVDIGGGSTELLWLDRSQAGGRGDGALQPSRSRSAWSRCRRRSPPSLILRPSRSWSATSRTCWRRSRRATSSAAVSPAAAASCSGPPARSPRSPRSTSIFCATTAGRSTA